LETRAAIKVDLAGRYRFLNQKAFGGELPDVPLRWMKSKRLGGTVSGTYYRDTGKMEIKGVSISEYLVTDEAKLDAIMLHEMVHVKVMSTAGKDIGGMHGLLFRAEMRKAESRSGMSIPMSEDLSGWELSEDVPEKELGVFILKYPDGRTIFQVFNLGAFTSETIVMRAWVEYHNRNGKRFSATWVLSRAKELRRFTEQRKFSKTGWYRMTTEMLGKIMTYGQVVDELQPPEEKVAAMREGRRMRRAAVSRRDLEDAIRQFEAVEECLRTLVQQFDGYWGYGVAQDPALEEMMAFSAKVKKAAKPLLDEAHRNVAKWEAEARRTS
jgi:hypothetical protein